MDTSNVPYSCDAPQVRVTDRRGKDPAPTCTWSPSKAGRLSRKPYMAPNLSRSFKGGSLTNGDYGEGGCKRRSLGTMLALPVDERRENDDCHGSV